MNEKKQSSVRADEHIKLFIPGPTEVRPEVLDAQTDWMIGHRMPECLALIGRIRPKLRKVFMTEKRVLISASTGTGFMEAAIRNTANKDAVSSMAGVAVPFDAWDLDVLLTSSQKAFALPAGLAFAAVSDRAMDKAKTVPGRGWYFDFLVLEKYLLKNQTPATTAVSLLYALDKQLDDMMTEGMENRYARHLAMRDRTITWAKSRGLTPATAPPPSPASATTTTMTFPR